MWLLRQIPSKSRGGKTSWLFPPSAPLRSCHWLHPPWPETSKCAGRSPWNVWLGLIRKINTDLSNNNGKIVKNCYFLSTIHKMPCLVLCMYYLIKFLKWQFSNHQYHLHLTYVEKENLILSSLSGFGQLSNVRAPVEVVWLICYQLPGLISESQRKWIWVGRVFKIVTALSQKISRNLAFCEWLIHLIQS